MWDSIICDLLKLMLRRLVIASSYFQCLLYLCPRTSLMCYRDECMSHYRSWIFPAHVIVSWGYVTLALSARQWKRKKDAGHSQTNRTPSGVQTPNTWGSRKCQLFGVGLRDAGHVCPDLEPLSPSFHSWTSRFAPWVGSMFSDIGVQKCQLPQSKNGYLLAEFARKLMPNFETPRTERVNYNPYSYKFHPHPKKKKLNLYNYWNIVSNCLYTHTMLATQGKCRFHVYLLPKELESSHGCRRGGVAHTYYPIPHPK